MSLNAFATKTATNAVIVGQPSNDLEIVYWAYLESVHIVIFGFAQIDWTFSIFPS